MGHRTYIPQLVKILETVCKYIIRYRARLLENLPPNADSKLDAIIAACNVFLAVVPDDVPGDIGD